MFRCDRGCDGKFGNFVGTKHTLWGFVRFPGTSSSCYWPKLMSNPDPNFKVVLEICGYYGSNGGLGAIQGKAGQEK